MLLDGRRLIVKSSRSQAAVRVIQDAFAVQAVTARLRGAGLSDVQVRALLAPPPLPIDVLAPRARNADRNRNNRNLTRGRREVAEVVKTPCPTSRPGQICHDC